MPNLTPTAYPKSHQASIDRAGTFQGSLWPNGNFGFSVKRSKGYEYTRELQDTIDVWCETGQRELPLSVPTNSHSHIKRKSNPRGTNGISSFGRKMVENAAFLLDKRFSKERLSFATLTLPACTQEEGWIVSSNWAEIVRVFFQKFTRLLARSGLPTRYVYVTEMQDIRAQREGHPALHIHFVFVGKFARGSWVVNTSTLVGMWSSVLEKYLPGERYYRKSKVLEPIKKSVEGYLGKYMSKGSDVSHMQPEDDIPFRLPTSWWGMDNVVRRYIKKIRCESAAVLSLIADNVRNSDFQGMFKYVGEVKVETPVGNTVLGVFGKIHRDSLPDFWGIARRIEGFA